MVEIANMGVRLGDGTTGAELADVRVLGMSGVCLYIGCAPYNSSDDDR
jgi:hypothetical protein